MIKMIVTKTLEVLKHAEEKYENNIFILGNRVLVGSTQVMTLKDSETTQMAKLLSRNNNIKFSNSWIDYMKKGVEIALYNLNQTNYYKYEDRGWTFVECNGKYNVDIFLDNYDIEQFIGFEIPVNEISKKELLRYADEEY
jgi:hypothetical protein